MKPQGRNLRVNMKGDDIKRLQHTLVQLGMEIEGEEGRFGKATRRAVKTFQQDHNLEPTGEVDKETVDAIKKVVSGIGVERNRVKVPKSFFRSEVLFSKLTDTSKLKKEDKDFISPKLNDYLHNKIVSTFASEGEEMKEAVKEAVSIIDYEKVKDTDLSDLIINKVLPKIKEKKKFKKEIKAVKSRLANANDVKISDYLNFDKPLNENPILKRDILR